MAWFKEDWITALVLASLIGGGVFWLTPDSSQPATTNRLSIPNRYERTDDPTTTRSYESGDRDCPDFSSQAEAQRFFIANGGPTHDPHNLDRDGDGIACESL